MILPLLLIYCCVAIAQATQADPTSTQGNIEAVCQYVHNGISSYGEKIARYQAPDSCLEYEGIGAETLKKFFRQDSNCYKDIVPAVCAIQFVDYEASSTCKSTNDFFFKLLDTCKASNGASLMFASCASFDVASGTIVDPNSFCNNSYLRIDHGSNADGTPASSTMKTFENSEKLDCKRIAEAYNACMYVGVQKLGYSERFCDGGGFGAYCLKYPTFAKDPMFKAICENVVAPYLMYMNDRFGNREDHCVSMYLKDYKILSTKKTDALQKARSAKDSLASIQKSVDMINSFKKTIIELYKDNTSLDNESTVLLNQMRQLSDQKMAYDFNISTQFQKLVTSTVQAETSTQNIKYKTPHGTTDQKLDIFSESKPTIYAVVNPQKEALAAVREIKRMIDSGGHVSYAESYGFFPIAANEIESERARIKKLSQYVQPFATAYSAELDKIPQTDTAEGALLRKDGKKYSELADIYAEQTALLVKFQNYGNQSGNPVIAATGAASKSAEAQAISAFA